MSPFLVYKHGEFGRGIERASQTSDIPFQVF